MRGMKGGGDDSKEKVRHCSFAERFYIRRGSPEMYNEEMCRGPQTLSVWPVRLVQLEDIEDLRRSR